MSSKFPATNISDADNAKRERLLRALERGEADIAAGRTTPYTPELLAQIERDARLHAKAGKHPNPEVVPFSNT